MGTCYFGACHDCRKFIDLDKFYWWGAITNQADLEREHDDLKEFSEGSGWVYRSMRLQLFLKNHNGHRVGVYNEHEFEETSDRGGWEEQFPWPQKSGGAHDTIHWNDPKAGRLIVKTEFGDIVLDRFADRVNCWRLIDGVREDTVLIRKKIEEK